MGRQAGRGGEAVALLWRTLVSLPLGLAGRRASLLVLSEERGGGCGALSQERLAPGLKENAPNIAHGALGGACAVVQK